MFISRVSSLLRLIFFEWLDVIILSSNVNTVSCTHIGNCNMNDNGINGDRIPGDGIYSVELSLRSSIPLGTHEIQIQAIDSLNVATPVMPVSIVVEQDFDIISNLDSGGLSSTVLIAILIGFTLIAAVAVFFLMRKSGDKDYEQDRFGFE